MLVMHARRLSDCSARGVWVGLALAWGKSMFTHQGCAGEAKCGSLKQIEVSSAQIVIRGYLTLCVEAELCIKKHGREI